MDMAMIRVTGKPPVHPGRAMHSNSEICSYWLAGKCNRNPCRFLHADPAEKSTVNNNQTQEKICEYWVAGNCVRGDKCRYLHSWSRGDGFSRFTQLEGHKESVNGITIPSGFVKLCSGSADGNVRIWDCISGQCDRFLNLGGQIGCLISYPPWIFFGLPDSVKAWNVETANDLTLDGPVGQVYAMVVGNGMLFAGSHNGVIVAWKGDNHGFELVASLKGHTGAVVTLCVDGHALFSGSMDKTIRVWSMETLACIQTLDQHTDVVMSLLIWDRYLISCSLDKTVKVWFGNEEGKLEVTYTKNEQYGVLALCGMIDTQAKPVLLCSCNDNSVRLYDLPSFGERGRIFSRREVRTVETGPEGLFFTGDATGLITVWKWLA